MVGAAPETPSRSPSPKPQPPSASLSLGAPRRTDNPILPSPGSNANSTASLPKPAHRMASTRSMLNAGSPPPPSRSTGRNTPPVKLAMTVTEQIARQTRKSTVLDPKNALLILAIPDYDDYKIMQPYSCRSLSNRSKFVGGRDFITRHNPQEVNDFKKQYSRDVGNLNRQRSIVAPPNTTLASAGLLAGMSSGSIGSLSSPQRTLSNNNSQSGLNRDLWRKTFTTTMKACWVLTDYGIQTLIGPEYRLTTRVPVLPALPSPRSPKPPMRALSCRSATVKGRPEASPLSAYSSRETARVGAGVDLTNEKTLAALSRLAAYSPKSRAHTPPCSPSRRCPGSTMADVCSTSGRCRTSSGSRPPRTAPQADVPSSSAVENAAKSIRSDGEELLALEPYTGLSWEKEDETDRERQQQRTPSSGLSSSLSSSSQQAKSYEFMLGGAAKAGISPAVQRMRVAPSTVQPFAMEVSPPSLALGTLHAGQVYLFPVRVRNVGFRQERFRVNHVTATCAGFDASIAEASYQREAARLAPGLAAVVTVALSFQHPGRLFGSLRVEAEGLGVCEIEIRGVVR